MMEIIQGLFDSVWALCVGVAFGVLVDRLGLVDWVMHKIMRK
tara:strand:- start:5045 stop:5170 length:126 start_codon:yes stop_codon:yes gene_type:complete